ncbi:hypothetical protein CVD25_04520 [Bacillus canaveralius]|uniref:Membrane protein YqhR n=1 Tax=Bacillus canaveralius TaxID=1403243 RepID=A0A2N5GRD8_9BACI|nr:MULTISPECIES: YqhR family membrane protein [Bacillus]PLR84468.1 hypothetical protein CVD23_11175 [Bacillus sp. V33-4]PLR85983.1 hypothetical protein CU635_02810 [Bacillus canaveralius]PLS00102.1 hypothetical protein CVD25_04520 [Bacillus canaveralius]
MSEQQGPLEQNQQEKTMSFIAMVILTGFFGGILWSGLAYIAYLFNFTNIRPNIILEPWALGDWKGQWLGTIISIIMIGIISIAAALLYYAVLRRFRSMWVGIGYGIVLFGLVFFILNPIFPGIRPFAELNRNTIITSICFYVLYGVFVGYSISYEENELRIRKKQEADVVA